MKIGVIGTGMIGGTLARLLAARGYSLQVAGRSREKADKLAAELAVQSATPVEAAAFADVVIVAVPLREMPDVALQIVAAVRNKPVVDTSNPYPARDGALAEQAVSAGTGTGRWSATLLPGARLVKCFNTLGADVLATAGNPDHASVALPIAADDAEAAQTVAGIVQQLGFVPVVLPSLADSRRFDAGTPAYGRPMPPAELARALAAA